MDSHSRLWPSQNGTLRLPQALILLLRTALAGPTNDQRTQELTDLSPLATIKNSSYHLVCLLNPFAATGDLTTSLFVGMVKLTALCGIGSAYWFWSQRSKTGKAAPSINSQHVSDSTADDASATDPGLLRKHSTLESYAVPSTNFTYPGIRTFYRPHPQESKFPRDPSPVPLLVFIHGLGGSIAQFHPILLSLSNVASCLAIDLPGCGLSDFEPESPGAYTTDSLVQLLAVVIERYRAVDEGQSVILIGHSMGCSLAALLASQTSPHANLLAQHVGGLVAICPKADPPTQEQTKAISRIASVPAWLFDIYRKWDRRGGLNSASVLRMAGPGAEEDTKKLQLRFNRQSRTAVWQQMVRGMCPDYSNGIPKGGLPGRETWSGLHLPVFLAAGEDDHVTPAENVKRVVEFLGRDVSAIQPPSEKASLPIAAAPFDPAVIDPSMLERKHQDSGIDANDLPNGDYELNASSSTIGDSLIETESRTPRGSIVLTETASGHSTPKKSTPHPRRLVVKTAIMPTPAAHSLLFASSTSRILSGLVGSFLADHIDPRLSLAWQLQYLSTEGKWDVKNLEKWQAVKPVSPPIAGVFRAMKTLREVDERHAPKIVAKEWAGKLCAVIDISHDNPVYDPRGLEEGGIAYYKFPTVSKQPPMKDEVQAFMELVDQVRSEGKDGLVGVHCHYGFNRTGFFLVCYLIERLNFRLQDAIDTFQQARPPGIRHSHFIDELHVRYCHGLRKAPTL